VCEDADPRGVQGSRDGLPLISGDGPTVEEEGKLLAAAELQEGVVGEPLAIVS
jgi:hypothetical protein